MKSSLKSALRIANYTLHMTWNIILKLAQKNVEKYILIWVFFISGCERFFFYVNYERHNKVVITNQFCTYETFFTFIYLAVRCNSSALCCLIYQVTIRVGRAQCSEINKKSRIVGESQVSYDYFGAKLIIVARFVTKLDRLGQFSYTVDVKRTLFIL